MTKLSLICLIVATVLLVSCGGGGSQPGDTSTPILDGNDMEELPNLTVVDFVVTPLFEIRDNDLAFTVTIQNTGPIAAEVTSGWLMESLASDFSSGFMKADYALLPNDGSGNNNLDPGELGVFRGRQNVLEAHRLAIESLDTHYVKFSLNPDRGLVFDTPMPMVMENRQLIESDYTDNVSNTLQVDIASPVLSWNCVDDGLEENDTLADATRIILDTAYDVTHCSDEIDIFQIDLGVDKNYSITAEGHALTAVNLSKLFVINPDGEYLVERFGVSAIFKSDKAGLYSIVIMPMSSYVTGDGQFEITEILN